MLGTQNRWQRELFVASSLEQLVPDDHILKRIDAVVIPPLIIDFKSRGLRRLQELPLRLFRILCQRKNTRSIRSQIECSIKPAFKEDGQLR